MKRKKAAFLLIITIVTAIFIVMAALTVRKYGYLDKVTGDQTSNVYEGMLGDSVVRMLIYRDGKDLSAYFVYGGDSKEYIMTGKYSQLSRHFTIADDTIRMNGRVQPETEDKERLVLKGTCYFKNLDIEVTFDLVPVWGFKGDRDSIYQSLKCDTQKVETFTDYIVEQIRTNDKEGLSKVMQYPLSVVLEGEQLQIQNEKEFVEKFDEIITGDFKKQVANSFRRYLWGNYMGISFADNGRGFLFYPNAENGDMNIIAITNCSENYTYPSNENNRITQG